MAAFEKQFTLHVPSSTENLALIREFVTTIGSQAGLTAAEVGQIELAVDEACANVIEHAYGHDISKEVVIRAIFDDETLRLEIIDTGKGFDPTKIPQEELNKLVAQRKSGGLGMRLIKTLMDEVQYEIVPGQKNELRMTKRITKKDEE
ncbi:MAG TPA: ATP-binding protein [Blastocatellia bacterium]|nr:ATP-binding protein [Blastocatellia bacterium]